METAKVLEEFQQTWAAMKGALDESRAEIKKLGAESGESQAKLVKMEAKMDELETKLSRPAMAANDPDAPEAKAAKAKKDVFFKLLRSGSVGALEPEERAIASEHKMLTSMLPLSERKALSLTDDTTGGFLAPPEYVQEIIKGVQLISPFRSLANVRTTSRRSIQIPVRSGVFAASWIGETATRSETTGLTYSMEEIPTFEMYAEVIVSNQDLEDSVFDLEAEIRDNAAEQFAKAEGAAFVSGDAIRKPEGFLTNSSVAYSASLLDAKIGPVPNASTPVASGDGLIGLYYALKTAYAQNAVWILNRQTMGLVRKLTDLQERYLWEPSPAAGTPSTILGSPYVEMPDMPDPASNGYPIAFGNFRRAYTVVDRIDMTVQRLSEKYAEQGQIAFLVRKRVGGQTVLAEAARKLKCAAS